MFGKKKQEDGEAKVEKGKLEDQPKGDPKVSKGFGNTIILFIVFFIVFTLIVTGVAFFADKLDLSGANKDKQLEDLVPQEKLTDPTQGESTEYVVDDKGDLAKKSAEELAKEKEVDKNLVIPAAVPEPAPKAVQTAKPAPKPAPLPPINIKPEPKKTVQAPKPAPAPVVKKAASPLENLSGKATSGDFVVQVASFKNKEYADKEKAKLDKILHEVFVVRADLGDKGVWYRVRCYNGISYQEAKAKSAAIAAKTSYKPYPMKK